MSENKAGGGRAACFIAFMELVNASVAFQLSFISICWYTRHGPSREALRYLYKRR